MDLFTCLQSYRAIYGDYQRKKEADDLYRQTKDLSKVDKLCRKFLMNDKAQKLIENSEINKRFIQRTFDNFKTYDKLTKTAIEKAKDYVNKIDDKLENCINLFICGDNKVGTGKTHLACGIANSLMYEKGIPCKFINVTNMIAEIKESFNISSYVDIPVLIIDDLGKETGTQWVCEQLYSILNNRYEKMQPTIITIESDIDSLSNNYGSKSKAIISRLKESFNLIVLNGEDYRQRRTKE